MKDILETLNNNQEYFKTFRKQTSSESEMVFESCDDQTQSDYFVMKMKKWQQDARSPQLSSIDKLSSQVDVYRNMGKGPLELLLSESQNALV